MCALHKAKETVNINNDDAVDENVDGDDGLTKCKDATFIDIPTIDVRIIMIVT